MAILSLTNEFEDEKFGGAGSTVTGMIQMFNQQGVKQTIIVPRANLEMPMRKSKGLLTILYLPRTEYYFGNLGLVNVPIALSTFPELKQNWNIIHIHAINFTPLAYTLAEGRIPILYSVFSFLRQELNNSHEPELQAQFAVQDDLIARCQKVHLISQSEKQYFITHYPGMLAKAEVLPIGISLPIGSWKKARSNRFLYVGRILSYKGLEDLMKAVFQVKLRGRELYIDVIGKGDPDFEAHLKHLIQSLKLSTLVQFHGWKNESQVWQWMEHAYALVVPSHRESFGLVALEGMAIGVPLIVSKAGGLSELADSSCALTFEPGAIQELSCRIITALDKPAYLAALAQRARERALTYDWKNLAPKYLSLYQKMIGG